MSLRAAAEQPSPAAQRRARRRPRARLRLALAVLMLGALGGAAGAQAATKSEQLQQVRDKQAALADQIQRHNGEVNALIGQVSAVRQREAQAADELARVQSELEQASAELDSGRARLAKLRKRLAAASDELEQMLVSLYKEGAPSPGALLLDSGSFEAVAAQNEYMERLDEYQSDVIERARRLRDETEGLVAKLAAEKQRLTSARDEAAQRRDELAAARAELEQQEAALRAARQQRRATLEQLGRREDRLVEALSTPAPVATDGSQPSEPAPAPVPGATAQLGSDGRAIPPASAPAAVKSAIEAANAISDTPYVWGGGHGSFESSGYDCSGSVSFALHGGGLLSSPLDSTGLMFWGEAGAGSWITVYANSGHTYAVIAGLRWDTSGGAGPRWHADARSSAGFVARHPGGL